MTAMKGVWAGLVGVAAIAGVITAMRRWLLTSSSFRRREPTPRRSLNGSLTQRARASWTRPGDGSAISSGLVLGLGMWTFGFNVLLPMIGAHPGTWKRREFALTLSAHTAYGLATAATLKVFEDQPTNGRTP